MNQVGRYQILNELGRGAAGIVYKALDPTIGRTLAIKSIRVGAVGNSEDKREIRDRLLREAQAAGSLSHPNIVTIYDILESDGFVHILMEYVDGDSLQELLRRDALPARSELWQFLRQIADGLDYAHRKGIIHRDIKPANILISKQQPEAGRFAKIADFGIATFVARDLAHNGAMIGTPNYMSPEQIQGLAVTGGSDQFALGTIVYELLCGAKPFSAETLPSLFYQICKHNPKPVESVNPALNETVGKVMSRVLSKDPAERFVSCSDFIGALSVALSESPDWAYGSSKVSVEAQRESVAAASNGGSGPVAASVGAAVADMTAEAPVVPKPDLVTALAPPVVLSGWERTAQRDAAGQAREPSASRKKLGLMLALLAAVAVAALFIIRWNSGAMAPVQTLDTKTGPVSPPPDDSDKIAQAPADLNSPPAPPVNAPAPSAPAPAARQSFTPQSTSAAVRPQEPTPYRAPTPDQAISDVELVSDPPGAKMIIDSNPTRSCSAPCSLNLPAGRHTLAAELNGYALTRKIFNTPSREGVFVSLAKNMGVLIVTSIPSGSSVSVDGQPRGQTPVTLNLTAGPHHLTLLEGAQRHDETIEIDTDAMLTRSFRW